mmetsp:Transcript_72548/g.132904  ORF Transcript_72548/g.132904 Transcript_72548/m.132904 type:complete len:207 (-) Transcript_72548:326-946(-)
MCLSLTMATRCQEIWACPSLFRKMLPLNLGPHTPLTMVRPTREIGLERSDMDRASRCGRTVPAMRASGWRTRPTAGEGLFMQMATSTRVNGRRTKLMGRVLTTMPMAPNMRDNGSTTGRVAKAWKSGQMVPNMWAGTWMAESMGMASFPGLTDHNMRASLSTMTSTVREFTLGAMVANTRASGRRTAWMAEDSSLGWMAGLTRAHT